MRRWIGKPPGGFSEIFPQGCMDGTAKVVIIQHVISATEMVDDSFLEPETSVYKWLF